LKLTTARYYTPSGRSIQAKGIEPDIMIDDGRESPSRLREANLEHHLEVPGAPGAVGQPDAALSTKTKVAVSPAKTDGKPVAKVDAEALPPRFEFGAADDFQLTQAVNKLKGLPINASVKTVSAQVKP
jgi:carboxyl-terminal processing protease